MSRSKKEAPLDDAPPSTAVQLAPPSPRSGYRLPVGAHPGNTGGKPGRSGRKPDAFKEQLESIRDTAGLPILEQMLSGEVTYTLRGVCEHCGGASTGPNASERFKLIPSPETRLRAADLTLRYTVGLEKTIRLEGPVGVQRAYDCIQARIREKLEDSVARALIEDIREALKSL